MVMTTISTEFEIARMTEHDLLEVVEIEESSGLSRWGWAAYYAELQSVNRDLMLVARSARKTTGTSTLAGYIVARETAGELHINNVAVRESFRRKGLGSALITEVLKKARELAAKAAFLEVRSSNIAAQEMYSRCGFKSIARRPNYYSEPREDAMIMTRLLE
jgi:ribosomal-protein-alanine N-acetyltransferase